MITVIRKFFALGKLIAYGGLAIMLYSNFIGPEGVAEILKVDNPTQAGLEMVGIMIPKYILTWTLGTVILEVVDNFVAMFEPLNYKY